MSDEWKFKEVTSKQMDDHLRQFHVPEDVIKEFKVKRDAYFNKNVRLANSTDESEVLISSVDREDVANR